MLRGNGNLRQTTLLQSGVLVLLLCATALAEEPAIHAAKPIWPAGRETEMNLSVGFRAVIQAEAGSQATLRVAAATIYRASVNGQFVGLGPARGPHGYYRVDSWNLHDLLRPGPNVIAIEVAGYNVNSYYLLDQPSFLQAEVTSGDQIVASTAGPGVPFEALILGYRVQKVQRYSFQRPFIEVYRLAPGWDAWQRDPAAKPAAAKKVATAVQPAKKLLPRRVLEPDFALRTPVAQVAAGKITPCKQQQSPWKDRSLTNIGPKLKGYPERQLAIIPSLELQKLDFTRTEDFPRPYAKDSVVEISDNSFRILDLGADLTGTLAVTVQCVKPTRLYLAFDEILSHGDVDFRRLGCVNAVTYDLEPGQYRLESIEPYTLRYLKLICTHGACRVEDVYLREVAHPALPQARFAASDPRLGQLFAAGVETFRQNTLDLFMDCPSRERAGWLCDSFFTARAAGDLCGVPLLERNFFENFLLPQSFPHLPSGMLPMCYPADHNDGVFIPNWSMWFVLQLEEYAARSGDRETVAALRPKLLRLLEYFQGFENSDGLLEKLPGWVFVEWSAANHFVQDVNYPTNMLYAEALSAVARIYDLPDLRAKGDRIRATIRKQSFDGRFFVDNALRRHGKLEPTRNRSEVCQYFAFFFGVADRQAHAELWTTLRDQFGPDRATTKAFPEVCPANSFVGNMLRMELLSQAKLNQQILDESIAYLLYMAQRTGTLWENTSPTASCDHGFGSHVVHTLYRDVLGIYAVDPVQKTVQLRLGDLKLDWCEGSRPTPEGNIDLSWRKDQDQLLYRLSVPAGYRVSIENCSGLKLLEEPAKK
jgi:alpha-L-rhamnosidase